MYVPLVLIDINPHTKFQVATIIGTLKSTSYDNLNLSLTGSCTYGRMDVQCTHVITAWPEHYMPPSSSMAGAENPSRHSPKVMNAPAICLMAIYGHKLYCIDDRWTGDKNKYWIKIMQPLTVHKNNGDLLHVVNCPVLQVSELWLK